MKIVISLCFVLIFIGFVIFMETLSAQQKEIAEKTPVNFVIVKKMNFKSPFSDKILDIFIYEDQTTRHLYMFYYGSKGISISRYYE